MKWFLLVMYLGGTNTLTQYSTEWECEHYRQRIALQPNVVHTECTSKMITPVGGYHET